MTKAGRAERVAARAAAAVGRMLQLVFRAILTLRRPRPIHAQGHVLRGQISWIGTSAVSGVSWIDSSPSRRVDVVARLSRSVGLPAPLPDVIGLAVRGGDGDAAVDLELASTGLGVPSRFLLTMHRSASLARFGSLFPYRGARGAVMICAIPVGAGTLPAGGAPLRAALECRPWPLRLLFATPTGRWHHFADLTLQLRGDQSDQHLRFDSVRRVIPGAATYAWVCALRQPTYEMVQGRAARRRS